ncbi:hypothetical protein A6R71_09930 [Xanthomonas translucens pv. arrhenatheri]|uniref:Uncharacterized protein n=1 Tax=Xanthomonas graminis pv. arrhenatheri LMG 727 TaxID=1195923 RepID=A0A0K2ZV88_9XANT|nr:hypothetical protein [Xanthomonas translucens]OAX64889.1 hypothetical protein A6R71_09930 [Xanthomonas translucens pv. arrhenatheri]UKE78622.1 hypothetical protein KM317_05165 [Xanthomonas translucens pv. arrhenatheri]CTP88064.1 hypothetical protein XTALMG727_2248 [Xanthomonas translucens pv. arrhenatheri LMG 727]
MTRTSAWPWFPVLLAVAGAAQALELPAVIYPPLPAQGGDGAAFVPSGWRLESERRGDLNGDGRADLLLVLKMADPRNVLDNTGFGPDRVDTNPRMLAVAFAEGEGYRLALRDPALIPRPDAPNMEDYLDGGEPAIARGTFSVTLHQFASAGSWSTAETTFRFRYRQGCFQLIGYDVHSLHRGSGEVHEISANYLTGKAKASEGSIEDDALRTQWRQLPRQPLRCLAQIGDGLAFDPGVERD